MSIFKKAVKHEAKLRLALSGASGAGKTYTALEFATALSPAGKIVVIDTEHGSASKYADRFNFDVLELNNFHPNNYIKAIKAAESEGYEVIVLDSITHAWNGTGGILEIVGGRFDKWKEVNPIERAFIDAIISCKMHVIATMRAKMQVEVEKDERGKAVPKKVGMGAIQRDGIEYEFDITCMMDLSNNLTVEKTRCFDIAGMVANRPDRNFMRPILAWLSGEKAPEKSAPKTVTPASISGLVTTPEPPAPAGEVTQPTLPTVEKVIVADIIKELISEYPGLTIAEGLNAINSTDFMGTKPEVNTQTKISKAAGDTIKAQVKARFDHKGGEDDQTYTSHYNDIKQG